MIGMIELATKPGSSFWVVVETFALQMGIGLAFGIVGGLVERQLLQRLAFPSSGLHTVRTLALAGLVYGAATVAHGSGFLAVFVAGLLVGDLEVPFKAEIETFQDGLSTLAEILVFVALGLTISLGDLTATHWAEGIALAAFTAVVARPLALGPLLLPTSLRRGEVMFVMWGGLKGAVPILLAAFAVGREVPDAHHIYDIVFVVVLVSVVVQGSSLSFAARRLGVTPRA
jgi:cell volume regulation protein A